MDTFFTFLKKGLVATVFVMFGLVATYVPVPHQDNVPTAEAAWATIGLQATALVQQGITAIASVANQINSWGLYLKEYVLDTVAWVFLKAMVGQIVQSMIDWINSGFKGRPGFITDIKGFLFDVGDRVFGEYIEELGAVGSFICSPFRLDISLALELSYLQGQRQPAPTCTLTGIIDNMEGFLDGSQGSFSEGGWNDWFDMTSQPDVYTPYGAYLTAEKEAHARIVNAKGEEFDLINFADGFLSTKKCETVVGPNGVEKEKCEVTTPGKTLQEALSFNLDSGRQSLIAADEMNELVAALVGQVANQLFNGAKSLLDL